jgi:hypothetical protein
MPIRKKTHRALGKVAPQKNPIIYQTRSGALELRGDVRGQTVWATLDQIAQMFDRDKSVISRHFKKIFSEKELIRSSVVAKNATTAVDGKTYRVEYYNLDAIISVGYRVNSHVATRFRQWATQTLHAHIRDGYTINRARIAANYDDFLRAVGDVQNLLPTQVTLDPKDVLELIKEFASTWLSLDAYDKETLELKGTNKKKVMLVCGELMAAIAQLKTELCERGEATDLFATERQRGNIEGIVGNVMQSFSGAPVYPTIEEKPAHLLYFMVKNHPFTEVTQLIR